MLITSRQKNSLPPLVSIMVLQGRTLPDDNIVKETSTKVYNRQNTRLSNKR